MAPQFLKHRVILCLERRYPKQNSVIRLKIKHFTPKIFGLATLMCGYGDLSANGATQHCSSVSLEYLHRYLPGHRLISYRTV